MFGKRAAMRCLTASRVLPVGNCAGGGIPNCAAIRCRIASRVLGTGGGGGTAAVGGAGGAAGGGAGAGGVFCRKVRPVTASIMSTNFANLTVRQVGIFEQLCACCSATESVVPRKHLLHNIQTGLVSPQGLHLQERINVHCCFT